MPHKTLLSAVAMAVIVLSTAAVTVLAAPNQAAAPPEPPSFDARWGVRLSALAPADPQAYFDLAEDVADAAAASGPDALRDRDLARQLFGLAGALSVRSAQRLGSAGEGLARSSLLALAELAEAPVDAARLRTAAMLLDRRGGAVLGPGERSAGDESPEAALALSEALSHFRRGQGQRVTRLLEQPGVATLLDRYGSVLDGGADRVREDARAYRGQGRPNLRDAAITRMVQLELGLLAGRDRPWSADRLLTHDEPLAEVDPSRLEELLEVDAERPLWRNGRWVEE